MSIKLHFHASVLSPAASYAQTSRGQDVGRTSKPQTDVWTPAGVAKMLMKDSNKISSKDLKEGWQHRVLMRSSPFPLVPTLNLAQMLLFPTRSHAVPLHSSSPTPSLVWWRQRWHCWRAGPAAEGGHLPEEDPAAHQGGAGRPHQMVR